MFSNLFQIVNLPIHLFQLNARCVCNERKDLFTRYAFLVIKSFCFYYFKVSDWFRLVVIVLEELLISSCVMSLISSLSDGLLRWLHDSWRCLRHRCNWNWRLLNDMVWISFSYFFFWLALFLFDLVDASVANLRIFGEILNCLIQWLKHIYLCLLWCIDLLFYIL